MELNTMQSIVRQRRQKILSAHLEAPHLTVYQIAEKLGAGYSPKSVSVTLRKAEERGSIPKRCRPVEGHTPEINKRDRVEEKLDLIINWMNNHTTH